MEISLVRADSNNKHASLEFLWAHTSRWRRVLLLLLIPLCVSLQHFSNRRSTLACVFSCSTVHSVKMLMKPALVVCIRGTVRVASFKHGGSRWHLTRNKTLSLCIFLSIYIYMRTVFRAGKPNNSTQSALLLMYLLAVCSSFSNIKIIWQILHTGRFRM